MLLRPQSSCTIILFAQRGWWFTLSLHKQNAFFIKMCKKIIQTSVFYSMTPIDGRKFLLYNIKGVVSLRPKSTKGQHYAEL